jgi:hypothetical protein
MKNSFRIIFSLVIFLSVLQSSTAQYVAIPDTNFRTYLQTNIPNCFNKSGQMDTTCPGILITGGLLIQELNITNLTGLQYFKNLQTLECWSNKITYLPALPASLTYLDCSANQLTSMPNLPNSLTTFYCAANQLTSLPNLPASLINFDCNTNQLTNLPALPTSLSYLPCYNNRLTSLPTLPDSLTVLYCHFNQLISLPILPTSLTEIWCYSNQLINLPTLPDSLRMLDCHQNPLECLPLLPIKLTSLYTYESKIVCIPNLPPDLTSNNTLPVLEVCNDTNNTNNCALQQATGITSSTASATQLLFPNPSTGTVTIQGSQLTGGLARVINSNGNVVAEQNLSSSTIDLSGLPKGLYMVQVNSDQSLFTQKLVLE